MERGLMMVVHSVGIGLVTYLILFFLLKQKSRVAEDRSVLLGALSLAYMVLFGHGLPTTINKNIIS